MLQAVEKRWDADGAAKNIGLGFIPDFAILIEQINQTNPSIYWYTKQLDDAETMTAVKQNGSDGAITRCTTDATGMKPFSTPVERVSIPAPDGDGYQKVAVYGDWSAAVDYDSVGTIRSTTVCGTVVRPPTHNGRVFELTTKTGTATSEPSSWDVKPGTSVTDGGSNVFICREERISREGAQGLTVGADIQTDGYHCVLIAFKFDSSVNAGDSAAVPSDGVV